MMSFTWSRSLIGFLLLTAAAFSLGAGVERNDATAASRQSLDYFVIVTGSELLRGIYGDEHTQFITRTLAPLGYRCLGSVTVGDVPADLFKALDFARAQAPLIITTGGLGPTSQDITRQVLSDYTKIDLKESSQRLADLRLAYAGAQSDLQPILRGQALVPTKGTYMSNPNGTAVGVIFDDGQRVIAALPGPKLELQPMVRNELIPYLSARFGMRAAGRSLTLRFAGIGQSRIDQIIQDHLKVPKDLLVWSSFRSNRVDIMFSFPGDSPQATEQMKALQKDLLEHIGEYLYSDDGSSLEEQVVRLLERQKGLLVLSEIASRGAVSSGLLAADRASDRFKGGYVAASRTALIRLLGYEEDSVSPPASDLAVLQMARRAAEKEGASWALAVGPLDSNTDGSTGVWVAAGSVNRGFVSRNFSVRKGRELRRDELVTHALDLLRKQLAKSSP